VSSCRFEQGNDAAALTYLSLQLAEELCLDVQHCTGCSGAYVSHSAPMVHAIVTGQYGRATPARASKAELIVRAIELTVSGTTTPDARG